MLLVIDVGNTNIVFGIYDEEKLLYNWRISSAREKTSDEYGLLFEQILSYHGLEAEDIEAIIISSVVPTISDTLRRMSDYYFKIEPIFIGPGVKTGMEIRYDNPKEVGADRIVNGVAAYEKYGGPLIVVDFGTAITFDAIAKDGAYLGGAITPGIGISADALFSKTAKLPKVELIMPDRVIGKNTTNSIQSGLIYGYKGMVDHIINTMKEEMSDESKKVKVVATGGLADKIVADSKNVDKIDHLLTLEGLRIIYNRNKS